MPGWQADLIRLVIIFFQKFFLFLSFLTRSNKLKCIHAWLRTQTKKLNIGVSVWWFLCVTWLVTLPLVLRVYTDMSQAWQYFPIRRAQNYRLRAEQGTEHAPKPLSPLPYIIPSTPAALRGWLCAGVGGWSVPLVVENSFTWPPKLKSLVLYSLFPLTPRVLQGPCSGTQQCLCNFFLLLTCFSYSL